MAVIQQSTPRPGIAIALVRYFASVLFAVAVITIGSKIAVDHWPCEFISKWNCVKEHAMAQRIDHYEVELRQGARDDTADRRLSGP